MDLNKVMLIGNVTRDPEIRNTTSGTQVASFSIATNFTWKDQTGGKQSKAEFHNIVAWRKLAEIIGQYIKKGSKIYIEGRLQTRDWTGQDGTKRYTTEVVADNMIMLGGGGGGSQNFNQTPPPPTSSYGNEPNAEPTININEPASGDPNEEEIKVENIPF